MTCSFCMHRFEEEDGLKACGACASFGGCRHVKCPRCGYEMPQTPDLVKLFGRILRKRRVSSR
jgi:rubredoxin